MLTNCLKWCYAQLLGKFTQCSNGAPVFVKANRLLHGVAYPPPEHNFIELSTKSIARS